MSDGDLLLTVILVAVFVGPIIGFWLAWRSIAAGRLPGIAGRDEVLDARQTLEHGDAVKDNQPEQSP